MADIFELFKLIAKKDEAPVSAPTHMVVGLGNPGKEYTTTRHNAGFRALDFILAAHKTELTREKFHAFFGTGTLGPYSVVWLKPLTFMNSSGEAVREAADFYKIPPENILVLVDDIYLQPGRMRLRSGGSPGGHNGLESIIECLGSDKFPRIRLGVGQKPTAEYDLADWVLSAMPQADDEKLQACFPVLEEAILLTFDGKTDRAMSLCNGFRAEDSASKNEEQE